MKIYGVLGYPVKHSLSPLMHNAAFKSLKIPATYQLFEIKPQNLKTFLKNLAKNNIYGINITIPYKEKVTPFLNKISPEAKLIGAVNTIRVCGNKLFGFNTDGAGFLRHLTKDLKFNPKGKVIALLGAGGAARAVSLYLAKTRPQAINIYDIDQSKVTGLVAHLKKNFPQVRYRPAHSVAELNIGECNLLINATPIGMKTGDPCLCNKNLIHKNLLVYDLIYNPAQTALLKIAKAKGARPTNGLGMLLYQGALSFELWTNKAAPVAVMRRALIRGIRK